MFMLSKLCMRDFETIKRKINSVLANTEYKLNTRRGAEGMSQKMENLETIFLAILWIAILERVNKTSKVQLIAYSWKMGTKAK